MTEKEESFRRGLSAVRAKAADNFNHVTVADILASFPDRQLTKKEIALIHQYLKEEHIILEGYKPHDTRTVTVGEPRLNGEEKAYFQMYLSDLEQIPRLTEAEEKILVQHLLSGDESAQTRLIEGNLHRVLEMAKRRAGNGVIIGDLVQEGNMTLVTAIEEYRTAGVRISGESLAVFLEKRIDDALKALIAEQGSFQLAGETMAREANRLLRVTKEFEEDNGRAATLPELAEAMQLAEDEVENLIRVSYSAMQKGDESESAEGQ